MTLVATNICKRFGGVDVLKGVSISASRGDVITLIGSSGSGKSTFLRCLNLLEKPTAGDIELCGERLELKRLRDGTLDARRPEQLRRFRARMGMVFQQFNLWTTMTAIQNVMEGPVKVLSQSRRDAQALAMECLSMVGMQSHANRYPVQLSGGQQQRVAIARTLAMRPEVILFDEPTSALDPELVGDVLGVIKTLADSGMTMIIVTHEMAFARDVATKAVFLNGGLIEEEGTSGELFGNPRSARLQQFLKRFENQL